MMSRQVEECPELPATTRSRKPGKADYPLGLPEGANPDGILISDFQLMERGQKPFVASLATLPWGVFYASSRKLIQVPTYMFSPSPTLPLYFPNKCITFPTVSLLLYVCFLIQTPMTALLLGELAN